MSDAQYRKLEDALVALRREFNEYRNVNPLENSAIRAGRLRFIGGTLRVDSGGRLELEGTLEGGGTILWTGTITNNGVFTNNGELLQLGPWVLEGDGTITGDVSSTGEWTQIGRWHLNGDGSISGDADITGILTLLKDLIVSSVGKIVVQGSQPIQLHQVGGLARMDLGSTASIWSAGDGVTINASGSGYINVHSGGVDIGAPAGVADIVGAVRLSSLSTAPVGMTTVPLVVDPSTGRIYRG